MKHIDWKATARARTMQTKVFEPVVSLNMLIVMNGSTRDHSWQGSNRRLFERCVTVAASVAGLAGVVVTDADCQGNRSEIRESLSF